MTAIGSEPPNEDRAAPAEAESGFGRTEVLVVVDPVTRAGIEATLEGLDAEIVVTAGTEDALRELDRRAFAVALLHGVPPATEAFEVARWIRESARHLPIVFVTTPSPADVGRCYALGAVDVLIEPLIGDVLRTKIQAFVDLGNRALRLRAREHAMRELERQAGERQLEDVRLEWEAAALRQAVEHEREQNVRLQEVEQQRDKLLCFLAHELRNPLVSLVANLERVRARSEGVPEIAMACSAIDRQLEHLVRVSDDLIDMTEMSQGTLELRVEPLDVRECVEHAVAMHRPDIERAGHRLHVGLGTNPLPCRVDRVRVTQIVGNLLAHALRVASPRGEIRIAAGIDGSDVVLRLRHSGGAVDDSTLDRLFEPEVRHGTKTAGGLGLAIVKKLVELHAGRVRAHSLGQGRGCDYEVALPCTAEMVAPPPAIRDYPTAAVAVRRRVLLVEDNDDIREIVQELLTEWGHEVHVAANGTTAITTAIAVQPDVVLLDIGLPDLDGCDVALRIRGALGSKPLLVAFTAFGREEDRVRSLDSGFDAHLVKPPRLDALRDLLGRTRRRTGEVMVALPPRD